MMCILYIIYYILYITGFKNGEARALGPPIYPLNTHHDVFVPGPSKLFRPGGLYDTENVDDTEDYKRFLQTHKAGSQEVNFLFLIKFVFSLSDIHIYFIYTLQ